MVKSKHFFGQPIFSKLINLINKNRVESLFKEQKCDHNCKKFSTFQHLITMSYGVLSGCNSLREMSTGILSYGNKLTHCKFSYVPKRSTISDENSRLSYKVFEAIYYDLLKKFNLISLFQKHMFTYIKIKDFFYKMDEIIKDDIFYNNKDEYIQLEIPGLTI